MHKIYTPLELDELLNCIVQLPGDSEPERIELKEANDNFPTKDIGKYFSALSNEANLHKRDYGRLIFGIEDKTKKIIGTTLREDFEKLHNLKHSISQNCNLTFVQIYEHIKDNKRIVFFQIPPAIPGIVTEYDGFPYGRNGQSLVALTEYERSSIKSQKIENDQSAVCLEYFSFDDIDKNALLFAKEGYKRKHPDISSIEVDNRDVYTFLKKARMLRDDKITYACMILLGKDESVSQFFPWLEMSRILKDSQGLVKTNKNFKPPFVLSSIEIIKQIRQIPQKLLPIGSLMPIDIIPYDDWVLRELLANAICHQDYTKQGRIGIQEFDDHLIITNPGTFFSSESFENIAIKEDFLPTIYRNPFLKDAMSEIKMIEYAGSGIRKIFMKQKERFMPMPEDVSTKDDVRIRLEGKIINENYAKILENNNKLFLSDVILLDKLQKEKSVSTQELKQLKSKKLAEGSGKHLHISLNVAQQLDQVGDYIMHKANLDAQRSRIYEFIKLHSKGVAKSKIYKFVKENKIFEKGLSEKEETKRLQNILSFLQKDNNRRIKRTGSGKEILRYAIDLLV